jgi:hypothetical protein
MSIRFDRDLAEALASEFLDLIADTDAEPETVIAALALAINHHAELAGPTREEALDFAASLLE